MQSPEEIAKDLIDAVPWQMDMYAWDELRSAIAAALRAYGDERAAQEREENIQAVIGIANSVPADVPYSGYLAYKLAIRNAIAAIRDLT